MPLLPSFSPRASRACRRNGFRGQSIGADGSTSGEVVFNTAMTGYQGDPDRPELLPASSPSYPHIGNTGSMRRLRIGAPILPPGIGHSGRSARFTGVQLAEPPMTLSAYLRAVDRRHRRYRYPQDPHPAA